ncbi:MAG TPA: hypothetical protein VJ246_01420 [Patescibacteria group bacterium]|nr:hypothetical protein [Patescibacteria group bacterium]
MIWNPPPRIKIYEALGAVADGRVHETENGATVSSSDGTKTYTVLYNEFEGQIMANDNGSYWQGYLGYPAIAFLMHNGLITYNKNFAESLKGIPWKQWNTETKDDYDKTLERVWEHVESLGMKREMLEGQVSMVLDKLAKFKLTYLGKKMLPPR